MAKYITHLVNVYSFNEVNCWLIVDVYSNLSADIITSQKTKKKEADEKWQNEDDDTNSKGIIIFK